MTGELWPAPRARRPVDATVALPGSKSITNRALVLAALADSPTLIAGALRSRDTDLMADGLRALGAVIDSDGDDWHVTPSPPQTPAHVDCGLAGTVMRFLPVVAALADGDVSFDGDPYARRRPLLPLIGALRDLGVRIDDGGTGTLPLTVHGTGRVTHGTVSIDASTSSQFISALLLAAPRFDNGITLTHTGKALPSAPHIAMTVAMLRERGAVVDDTEPGRWRVEPSPLHGGRIHVEPDLSNAAPFAAAALVTGGTVRFPGWPRQTTQPGDLLRGLLTAMGARCEFTGDGLNVSGDGAVHGIDTDLRDASELLTVIAALAALADSPSALRGVAHVRGHETDRLAALARELGALGADVAETADGLRITPGALHGGTFATYDDHRMATAAAVLGLAVDGVAVENIATTGKTLPGFTAMWQALLA